MKNKKILIAVAAAVCLIAGIAVWYVLPRTFLKTDVSEIASVTVFDGMTGVGFDITDAEEINTVAESIKNTKAKKDGFSLGKMGYGFRLSFYDTDGKKSEELTVNSDSLIRKDPFFYSCSGLCYDYLSELEDKYLQS